MSKGWVSSLASPFSAAKGEQVLAVHAVDADCYGRNKWSAVICTSRTPPTGEGLLEKLRYVTVGVGEMAGGSIAVIGGDNKPSTCCKAFDKAPELFIGQLLLGIVGEDFKATARPGALMDFAVGPLVPANPVQCAINKRLAVFPWHADTFGAGWLEFMRESATVVLQLTAGIETKRTCKFVGLAG